ncbi:MAG: phosphoribosyltransferase [Chloroflexi bacterium]|nr:phosphoribosyltransferase [Chloroflexota bacterium]
MFIDRQDAGQHLAARLLHSPSLKDVPAADLLLLSIPRGGVVVGAVVAQHLRCAHEVIIVKKIGHPRQEELALGALAEDGALFLDERVLHFYGISRDDMQPVIVRASATVRHYVQRFRRGQALHIGQRSVILVDDGIATGETMKAAVQWVTARTAAAHKIIIAVPICAPGAFSELRPLVDEMVCLAVPEDFSAVGQFYRLFPQLHDSQVLRLLHRD